MGTRPRPRQAAAAAAGGDGAWEARTGPRPTQTCSDTPASATGLRRGHPLTTLQPTKQQPATVDAVERGGRVTTARQTTTRAVTPRLKTPAHIRTLALHWGSSQCTFLQMTYTAVNPHACCNWPRPEDAHAAARPPLHPRIMAPHLTNNDGLRWKTRSLSLALSSSLALSLSLSSLAAW